MFNFKKIFIFLITALFLSFPFGQFANIVPFGVGFSVYLYDVIAVLIFLLFLFQITRDNVRVPATNTNAGIAVFLFICTISLAIALPNLALDQIIFSLFYLIRLVSYASIYFVIKAYFMNDTVFKHYLHKVFIISCLLSLFIGFAQLIFFPDFSKLDSGQGWDPHYKRLSGLFFDPNYLGAFLTLGFNYLLIISSPLAILLLVGIFITFSRSAWLMLAVSIFSYGVLKKPLLIILAIFIVVGAYLFTPRIQTRLSGITDPADSARFRLASWQNAIEVFKQSPIIGVGFNTYRYAQANLGLFDYKNPLGNRSGAGSDSSFLFVLATTGVVGFLAYSSFYTSILIRSFKQRNTKLGVWIFISLLGLFFESLFINSLFYPQIMAFIFTFVAFF